MEYVDQDSDSPDPNYDPREDAESSDDMEMSGGKISPPQNIYAYLSWGPIEDISGVSPLHHSNSPVRDNGIDPLPLVTFMCVSNICLLNFGKQTIAPDNGTMDTSSDSDENEEYPVTQKYNDKKFFIASQIV